MEKSSHKSAHPIVAAVTIAGWMLGGYFAATPFPSLAVERHCLQTANPGLRLEDQGCLANIPAEIRCGTLLCRRPKGGQDQALSITAPMGTSLLRSPARFRWLPSSGTQSYWLQVEGGGVQWQRSVSGTVLDYPADVTPLQPGQTYRITVIAVDSQGTPLAGKTKALSIVTLDRARQIQLTAQQLQQLPVDLDTLAAIDLRALYLTHGLAEEAIATLESRVATGTQNPLVYQALGQTYARVRNASKAVAAYQRAIELAQNKGQLDSQRQLETELKQLIVAWQSEPASRQ